MRLNHGGNSLEVFRPLFLTSNCLLNYEEKMYICVRNKFNKIFLKDVLGRSQMLLYFLFEIINNRMCV